MRRRLRLRNIRIPTSAMVKRMIASRAIRRLTRVGLRSLLPLSLPSPRLKMVRKLSILLCGCGVLVVFSGGVCIFSKRTAVIWSMKVCIRAGLA